MQGAVVFARVRVLLAFANPLLCVSKSVTAYSRPTVESSFSLSGDYTRDRCDEEQEVVELVR